MQHISEMPVPAGDIKEEWFNLNSGYAVICMGLNEVKSFKSDKVFHKTAVALPLIKEAWIHHT